MNEKGDDYYYGRNGVAKDFKQAVFWYRKSADQGNEWGQKNLGICYEKGKGVAKDLEQAVFWFRKSAEQGNDYAKKRLRESWAQPYLSHRRSHCLPENINVRRSLLGRNYFLLLSK